MGKTKDDEGDFIVFAPREIIAMTIIRLRSIEEDLSTEIGMLAYHEKAKYQMIHKA